MSEEMKMKVMSSLPSKPSESEIIDATLNLMKDIEKNISIPGLDKKELVMSSIRLVVNELDSNLINFVDTTLPHLVDVFVSLNKREFVIKAIEKGIPFCIKFCKK